MKSVVPAPQIIVLAGTNGAGKSAVAGEALRESGGDYFNPDEVTRQFLVRSAGLSQDEANARAWRLGRRLLARAIAERLDFAFETTLGGRTMTGLLMKASNVGMAVRIWYVGLASVELHLARVRARVAEGGHDIPESRIRARFDASRRNLIRLLPHLSELRLIDNSLERNPASDEQPAPRLILHVEHGRVRDVCREVDVPTWAKPIVEAAIQLFGAA